MNNNLKDILTEVLVFPYDEATVDSLSEACKTYAEEISLAQYEACVLHLCLDIPDISFIQAINKITEHTYPDQVYRALAGYVVGLALSTDQTGVDELLYPLALCNVLKCHQPGAAGIINKCIDPSCFDAIEDYWCKNAEIPAIEPSDLLVVLNNTSWADSSLKIEEQFENIKSLAKYYCRSVFEKGYAAKTLPANQDAYTFMNNVAEDLISRDWLYVVEEPVKVFKNLNVSRGTATLSTIKSQLRMTNVNTNSNIEKTSVFRRYIYSNDYEEISQKRISPLHFGIAIFYELLFEYLKFQNYE